MPEPILPIAWEYLKATGAYWWFVFVGVLMPLPDIWKHFHPQGRELPLPRWLRWTAGLVCVSLAQFLAYKDQTINLARTIEEKRQFSIQINGLTAELQEEKQKNAALSEKVPSETSLKSRALRAANEYERFFQRRAKHAPSCIQTSKMSPEEQRAILEPCNKYALETMDEYAQRFAPNIMAMVEEFRAKGMSVRDIENCAPQGWCGIAMSVQLRAFSARLEAKDNVKR